MKTNETTTSTRKPTKRFRAGPVSVSIWENEIARDDATMIRYTVRFSNRYKDKNSGEWKETAYYHPPDLPKLILVAQKAFEFTSLHESEEEVDQPTE